MYCGLKTKKNKALYALYCALALAALTFWILYIVFINKCVDDLEDKGCNGLEADAIVNGNRCTEETCSEAGIFIIIAILLSLLSCLPCCCFLCSPKPDTHDEVKHYEVEEHHDKKKGGCMSMLPCCGGSKNKKKEHHDHHDKKSGGCLSMLPCCGPKKQKETYSSPTARRSSSSSSSSDGEARVDVGSNRRTAVAPVAAPAPKAKSSHGAIAAPLVAPAVPVQPLPLQPRDASNDLGNAPIAAPVQTHHPVNIAGVPLADLQRGGSDNYERGTGGSTVNPANRSGMNESGGIGNRSGRNESGGMGIGNPLVVHDNDAKNMAARPAYPPVAARHDGSGNMDGDGAARTNSAGVRWV